MPEPARLVQLGRAWSVLHRFGCLAAVGLHALGAAGAAGAAVRGAARVAGGGVKAVLDLRSDARRHRPELPELPELRVAAMGTWRGRMINEYQSAEVFGALAKQAEHLGLAAKLVSQLCEFETEERKHGVLCGGVVEALGGEARAEVSVPRRLPTHAGTAPLEAFLRNALSVSCLSETVAVALIGAERLEMPEGAPRDVLSEIWAGGVGHA